MKTFHESLKNYTSTGGYIAEIRKSYSFCGPIPNPLMDKVGPRRHVLHGVHIGATCMGQMKWWWCGLVQLCWPLVNFITYTPSPIGSKFVTCFSVPKFTLIGTLYRLWRTRNPKFKHIFKFSILHWRHLAALRKMKRTNISMNLLSYKTTKKIFKKNFNDNGNTIITIGPLLLSTSILRLYRQDARNAYAGKLLKGR